MIVAVVVNAVLLLVLFFSAISNETTETCAEVAPIQLPAKHEEKEIKVASGDVIDQVLKDFSDKTKGEKEEKGPPKIDFAKELEAITKAASVKSEKTVAPERNQSVFMVTVVSGDSLAKIASRHGTTVEALQQANQLSTTVLQIGQKLKVPGKGNVSAPQTSDGYYTVKQGDNPWTIAVKNQIKVDELLKLNNLNEEKARRLRPGDRLKIR